MGEADWYSGLVDLGHTWGWRVHHGRAAAGRSGKWSTPIMGDKGFPDFVYAHERSGVVLLREIKGPRTVVTEEQKLWIAALRAGGLDADIWRMPTDWPLAVSTLSFGRAQVPP